jgi:hypothetical protein
MASRSVATSRPHWSTDTYLATNNGEHLLKAAKAPIRLDAFPLRGYDVEMTEEGTITATNGTHTLHGIAARGAIERTDRSLTIRMRERCR